MAHQQTTVRKGSAKTLYRRTEWLGLGDTSGDHLVQLLCPKNRIKSNRLLTTWPVSKGGDFRISLDSVPVLNQ